jgi:hypothetical protein
MTKGRSEVEELAHQFYRDHKKAVDLLRAPRPRSGFELAARRLFGENPKSGTNVRIGHRQLNCLTLIANRVSFLPASWQVELDKTSDKWPGCEKWWAGYPLISYVDMRAGDDGRSGRLILKAEVGPISDHPTRKAVIDTIKAAASARNLSRIQFPADATEEGQLYSLFLRRNIVVVSDIHSGREVESKFLQLIDDFEPEVGLIASVIPQLPFGGEAPRHH